MSRSAHNTGSLPLSLRFAQFDREPFAAASVAQRLVRTANALPGLLADLLHPAQNDDGRLNLSMHHSAGPRIWGDVPIFALVTYGLALLLSRRLVAAIARSGPL